MRITTQMAYQTLMSSVNNNMSRYREIQEMMANEQKLLTPSSDPVGITTSGQMRSQQASYASWLTNVNEADEFLRATDQAMTKFNDLLNQAMELAELNASETADADSRAIAAAELKEIIAEALDIANTKVRDRYIFSGYKSDEQAYLDEGRILSPYAKGTNTYAGEATSSGDYTGSGEKSYLVRIVGDGNLGTAQYQVSEDGGQTWSSTRTVLADNPVYDDINGQDAGVRIGFTDGDFAVGDEFKVYVTGGCYNGDDGHIEYNIGRHSRITANQNGLETLENAGYFDVLQKLRLGLESNNTEEISIALEQLDTVQNKLQPSMVEAGVRINRLEVVESNITAMKDSLTEDLDAVEKPDMIDLISQFTLQESALNASTAVLSKIITQSLLDYL